MSKYKVELDAADEVNDELEHETSSSDESHNEEISGKAITVGAVVLGAAVFEAALIPGIILGAAAMTVPKFLPKLSKSINPICNSAIRGLYKMGRKAKSTVNDMKEHVNDIAAEVKAEELSSAIEKPE
jgi:hypothetical protein